MATTPWTIVNYTPPSDRAVSNPFGTGTRYAKATKFSATNISISNSWGLQPAQLVLDYAQNAPISIGGVMHAELGGHHFWGVCKSDVPSVSTAGTLRTITCSDMRELLNWDSVYGCWNKVEHKIIDGQRVRRYWHILPANFRTHTKTFTPGPMSAQAIIESMLTAVTTTTTWRIFYSDLFGNKVADWHPDLVANPSLNIDCMNGPKLSSALQMVLEQHGILITIISNSDPASAFDLVFVRKGEGPNPTFPAKSNNRRDGMIMSEAPTCVRVVGGRNRYQFHELCYNVPSTPNSIIPDWRPAWEQFWGDPILLRDWIFKNLKTHVAFGTIPINTRYNAIPGDTEFVIGKQLAMARALDLTVGEFAYIRDSAPWMDGIFFRDFRNFAGKCRLDMPATLYLQSLVFRAFRLADDFGFTTADGQIATIYSADIVPEMLAEVKHDPINGMMTWDYLKAADGPGYGIAQGFQVGADAFKSIRPDRFDITQFTNLQNVWTRVPFTIDDSGCPEGNFIIFDQPVIRTSDLFTKGVGDTQVSQYNNFVALNIDATFTVPPIKLALTFEAEQFLAVVGSGPRDETVNISNLQEDFIGLATSNGYIMFDPIPYADGELACNKAIGMGNSYLARQWWYRLGGYTRPLNKDGSSNPTMLNGCIDRVSVKLSAGTGLIETVDFTGERSWLGFVPDRDFDRGERDKVLFPGQKEGSSGKFESGVRNS